MMGCASTHDMPVAIPVAPDGWLTTVLSGKTFLHRIYRRDIVEPQQCLRVFIEGDGTPWATRDHVASDPTPRNPILLRIATKVPGAALYLGRPCYFGLNESAGCGAEDWTFGRFAPDVIASMTAVIERQAHAQKANRVALVGHSGGGTLATLIAPRLAVPTSLVTIGAPLDVAAWTTRHAYTPLFLSLDPATQPALPPSILQLHLIGGSDNNIPADLQRQYLVRNPQAQQRILPGVEHDLTGWSDDAWADYLEHLLDEQGCAAHAENPSSR